MERVGEFFFFLFPFSIALGNLDVLCSAYLPSSSTPHEISLRRHLEPAFHRRHIAPVECCVGGVWREREGEREGGREKVICGRAPGGPHSCWE